MKRKTDHKIHYKTITNSRKKCQIRYKSVDLLAKIYLE